MRQARQRFVEALRDSHGHSHLPESARTDAGIDWEVEEHDAHDAAHAEGTEHSH